MKVRLISKTSGEAEYAGKTLDEIIVGIARVSSSREVNELFTEPHKLLRHLITQGHWSPFEMANMSIEITTSRAIGRQLIRHKSLSVQELCISGDSEISFYLPCGNHYKMNIEDVYRKWHKGSTPIPVRKKKVGLSKIDPAKFYSTQELLHLGFNSSSMRKRALRGEFEYIEELNKFNNKIIRIKGESIITNFYDNKTSVFDLKKRISNMNIKTFDMERKEFTTSHIKEVFYNGKKPLYKITTSSGRELKCTKEHKLYDGNSFVPLENIIDLKIDADNNVVDYRPSPIGVNGLPLHQSYEFLHNHKIESIKNGKGLQYIADKANVSYHTIRKWLKHYGLSYTKKEVAQYTEIWNKGKSEEYKLPRRTATQRQYMRDITPKGKNHHSYKGGGRCERLLIQSYINNRRKDIYDKCGEYCNDCKKTHISLELHHVEEVTRNPYKAYDLDNIVPLCKKCHQKRHRILRKVDYEVIYDLDNFDWVGIRPKDYKDHPYNGFRFKRKNSKDTAKKVIPKHTYNMDNIVSVEYIGLEDTYDLEIESTNHNYVANKIMVHNSQRYSEVVHFEKVELRKQAKSNRQSSADVIEDAAIIRESENFLADGQILYNDLLEHGVARETARMILPETAQSIVIFNGNIRSWISLLNQRLHHTAQKEARQVAESVKQIFLHHCPIISEMLFNFEHADKIHILDQVILEKYKLREQIL